MYNDLSICTFTFEPICNKLSVEILKGFSVVLNDELRNITGFTHKILKGKMSAVNFINLHEEYNLLYIHTDIIKPQLFGTSVQNVLKILNVSDEMFDTLVYDNTVSNYARLSINKFDVIHFEIRDMNNTQIKTQDGRVIIQLHFKKDM